MSAPLYPFSYTDFSTPETKTLLDQSIQISLTRKYTINNRTIELPELSPPELFTEEQIDLLDDADIQPNSITVLNQCAVEVALQIDNPIILSFSNAFYPGSGQFFSETQEDKLIKCTDLYATLIQFQEQYYDYNYAQDALSTGRMIVSDNFIFRDSNYNLLSTPKPVKIVSCAGVDVNQVSKSQLLQIPQVMEGRIRNLTKVISIIQKFQSPDALSLKSSASDDSDIHTKSAQNTTPVLDLLPNQQQCGGVILGAIGCGAYGGDPKIVASAFKKYGRCGENIVYAVKGGGRNLEAFDAAFQGEE